MWHCNISKQNINIVAKHVSKRDMFSEEDEKTAANWLKETQKGYMRIAVLILLNKKRHHGYEIMKEIKDRTKGFWRPTPGGIYPILQSLEKTGYIEGGWFVQKNRKRKIYKITKAGRLILKRALVKQSQIANNMSTLFEEFARDVLNVETKSLPMPRMPTPFSIFLEDQNEKYKNSPKALERRRSNIKHMINALQSELQVINRRLAELNS